LVAQAFRKYCVNLNKTNSRGLTACQEALRAGYTACVHAINFALAGKRPGSACKDVHSNDSVFLENVTPVPEVLRSPRSPRPRPDMRSPRPMTAAFLTRQDSYSTLTSSEEKRSNIFYPGRSDSRAQKRKFQNPLYFYGYKKNTDLIQCAPENDFRNTAEFVCKISHLPPGTPRLWPLVDTIECNGPWMGSSLNPVVPPPEPDQSEITEGWRHELKSIFRVYEHQCSPSWRSSRKLEFRPVTHGRVGNWNSDR
ncbi:hypothetical protein EGW08_010727, partial [Elysia chlorotica]